jgi:enamine deaminase RidA (YjgF/YER057c/UK114 family)
MAKRIEYINPKQACPPQGLYSHVTRVNAGTLYFVAGQLSVDRNGKVAGNHDFARQFRQVFENLEAVLKGIGTNFKDVVKFTPISSTRKTSKNLWSSARRISRKYSASSLIHPTRCSLSTVW